MHAVPFTAEPKPSEIPETFPKGRTCAERGCKTVLSSYNESERCSLHGGFRRRFLTENEAYATRKEFFEELMAA